MFLEIVLVLSHEFSVGPAYRLQRSRRVLIPLGNPTMRQKSGGRISGLRVEFLVHFLAADRSAKTVR